MNIEGQAIENSGEKRGEENEEERHATTTTTKGYNNGGTAERQKGTKECKIR